MILHCVFCNIRSDVSADERVQLFIKLAALCETVAGCIGFEHGPNRDCEKKSQGYSDGFVIRFETRHALETYATHPTHVRLGQALCALCIGGAEGVMVFDLEV